MKKILTLGLFLFIFIFITGCTSNSGSLINNNNVQPNINTGNDNPPVTDLGNDNCLIKGNISSSGEKIYHMPGGQYYDRTSINESKGERWFCSEQEAKDAGWRRSMR